MKSRHCYISKLEKIVGKRYDTLERLKNDIEILTNERVNTILESQSERFKHQDFMIDFDFKGDSDVYTIFYLVDNANHYYITEI